MSSETQHIEPTNEQLASFLVVYAKYIPQFQGLTLNPTMLKLQLNVPGFREIALKHHKQFQTTMIDHFEKMANGVLQCEYIRKNGKRCPNRNKPGIFYCGLHVNESVV